MENVNKHRRVLVKVCQCGSHINKKKLSKLEKKHDMACKKKSDKFALLIWDTTGTGKGHFFLWTKLFS